VRREVAGRAGGGRREQHHRPRDGRGRKGGQAHGRKIGAGGRRSMVRGGEAVYVRTLLRGELTRLFPRSSGEKDEGGEPGT
jgi:hypothetical protein